jgi:probable rRNA maturation factor
MRIEISYDHGILRLSRRETIRTIHSVIRSEGRSLRAISVVYTNNARIRTINRKHLNHNYVTDVIAFEIEPRPALEAEIYINLDRARHQARLYQQSFTEETKRLLIHGMLHVMGYDDDSRRARERMRREEDAVLAGLRMDKH